MPEKMWVVTTMLFFHDLFTVVWVGGMIALGIGMVPAVRRVLGMGPQMQKVVSAFQNRFRWFTYICVVGLAVTGVLLARRSPEFQSFFAWGDTYSVLLSVKHILVIVMVLIVIVRSVFLAQRMPEGASVPMRPHAGPVQPNARLRLAMLLLFVNIALGVAVLFLSAATTTLSSV